MLALRPPTAPLPAVGGGEAAKSRAEEAKCTVACTTVGVDGREVVADAGRDAGREACGVDCGEPGSELGVGEGGREPGLAKHTAGGRPSR